RIIGGSETADNGAPYIVALSSQGIQGTYYCGGTLISPSVVITAAHCVFNLGGEPFPAQNITVGYGSSNRKELQTVKAISATAHPKFIMPNDIMDKVSYDIAVIRIPKLKMDEKTSYISVYNHDIKTGDKPVAFGWGATTADHDPKSIPEGLKSVEVTVGDVETCRKDDLSYDSPNGDQICVLNKYDPGNSSCAGDSGTGLVMRYGDCYYLAGVTSEGDSPDGPACGIKSGYVMYTNVRSHLGFIEQATGIDSELLLGP
ncbi:hypothetical protein FB639_005750, partial [Coemansia asiatica]